MAIATSNFMNKVYNGRIMLEFSVSILKETITLADRNGCGKGRM